MYVKTFSLVCNGRTVILNDEGQQEDREGDGQEEDRKVEGQEEDHAVEGQEEDHEEMEDFVKKSRRLGPRSPQGLMMRRLTRRMPLRTTQKTPSLPTRFKRHPGRKPSASQRR